MARILIADDSPIVREPIAAALEQAGHSPLIACNGKEALTMLRSQRPDLLLLDLAMPIVDGFGVLEGMARFAGDRIPVVVMTEAADRTSIERAGRCGVRHYLSKSSFSIAALLDRVDAALAGGKRSDLSKGGEASTPSPALVSGKESKHSTKGTAHPAPSVASLPQKTGVTDALLSLKPLLTRGTLEQRVAAYAGLKALPPLVGEVVKLCKSEAATTEDIARSIRKDPAIAVKVLRLANSAAYATGSPVQTVEQAVVRVGVQTIGQAVLNVGVIDRFSSIPECTGIDCRLFWEHSIGCGLIAARLAKATRCMSPDAAFTMGLIHDIGRLIYAGALGADYQRVLDSARELGVPVEVVEKRLLLTTHAECMNRTLGGWGFPRDFADPVALHHCELEEIRAKASKRWKEVATLALANRFAHAMVLGSSGNASIYDTREMCSALGITSSMIEGLMSEVRAETEDLRLAMLAGGGAGAMVDLRAAIRTSLGDGVRPLYASTSPAMDGLGVFLDHVSGASERPPSIGVVYFSGPEDKAPVCDAYRESERQAEGRALPLLVLSRSGDIAPTSELTAGRQWTLAALPITFDRLIHLMKDLAGSCEVPARKKAA